MDSTARFLLGGALGAALGYLLSQKNLEKGQPAGQVPAAAPAASEPSAAPSVAPVVSAPEQRRESVPTPAAPGAEWTIPPAPPVDWLQAPAPAPAPSYTPAPVPAPTPVPAPVPAPVPTPTPSHLPEPAPSAPTVPVAPMGPSEPVLEAEVPTVAESIETEIILTREFLEEPVPGSGWRSSAPAMVEDETAETAVQESPVIEGSPFGPEVVGAPVPFEPAADVAEQVVEESAAELPVEEDVMEVSEVEESTELPVREVEKVADAMGPGTAGTEALAHAADVMGRLPVAESTPVDDNSRVDDLKSRIEETRRRIRHELEQPFDLSAPARPLERDWTAAPVMPVVSPAAISEPVVATRAVEQPVALEPLVEEAFAVEALPIEEVEVETMAVEPLVAEPVESEPGAGAGEAVAEPVIAQPVIAVEPVAAEPLIAEPVVAEPPVAPVAAAPLVTEPVAFEALPVEAAIVEAVESEPVGSDLAVELGLEEPVDYDSMKNRIESTRSRLKAKAFDAMMTGEAALLGRDLEGAARASSKVTGVDSEVDETIETSLREEEG